MMESLSILDQCLRLKVTNFQQKANSYKLVNVRSGYFVKVIIPKFFG